jgi:hypothetical protein
LKLIEDEKILMSNIYWMAFDGAANMSGRKKGVQAILKKKLTNAHYIHCRNHLLNLAAANVANEFKPLKALFSSFNSLWKFFHNSPKKHNNLEEMESVLNDPILQLVRAGDTRWTSNFRAVRAIRVTLRAIVYALQDIHSTAGDLSSEAGGLLLTFLDKQSLLLIFAVEQILLPLNTLTLMLQSPKLSLTELPTKIKMATDTLHEIQKDSSTYVKPFTEFMSNAGFSTTGNDVNYANVHSQIIVKYINALCKNIDKRFDDSVGHISVAATIFDPSSVEMPLADQVEKIGFLAEHFRLNKENAMEEWSCFRRYMDHHKDKKCCDIFRAILQTDLSDAFPQISKIAGIVLAAPIGTAGVERSFSSLNRLCNKLRQRLTPEHLSQLLLIAQEGPEPNLFKRQQLIDIVYLWYDQAPRRIQLPRKDSVPVSSTA